MCKSNVLLLLCACAVQAFTVGPRAGRVGRPSASSRVIRMDTSDDILTDWFSPGQKVGPQKPAHAAKKSWDNLKDLNAVEPAKKASGQLLMPLKTEFGGPKGLGAELEEIAISKDAVHILKHHGSYMQQDRSLKKAADRKKSYTFMLRLKVPNGIVSPELYLELDDMADKYGVGNLRATTRAAYQLHGVCKGDLKTVIANIANVGSNTLGGCGDINRNVCSPPCKFVNKPEYEYAKLYSTAIADLFKPMSNAFSELWLDGEKAATVEYWQKDLKGMDIDAVRNHDNGNGILTGHKEEPLYGKTYLPRKFKISVTVPGDNSVDLYTNDLGLVVIMGPDGKTLQGFNLVVGGGMGRTHNKETTFARVAEHLGYADKDDILELCKAIIAVQRDHGNREVRPNARLKYLVYELGIKKFAALVEEYYGKKIEPFKPLPPWEYVDWLGWHEQGDGNWFVGLSIEQGRVIDQDDLQLKTALKLITQKYHIPQVLSTNQNIYLTDIKPADKDDIEQMLKDHGVKMLEDIDDFSRKSIACVALPSCGLAMADAEQVMPSVNARLVKLCTDLGLEGESFVVRMTGCPNGCARPYMAELAMVGNGPATYQIWLGGSPVQTRTAFLFQDKMKIKDLEATMEPLLLKFKNFRYPGESFGDFCQRFGKYELQGDWRQLV